MNILILNWRDIKNPLSGGAEILTHRIAQNLVKNGHQVRLFSSFFPKAKKQEVIDGVQIIREGHPDARFLLGSVQFKAYQYYKNNRKEINLVIDEIHGVPFFTPFYVKVKKIALICEVAGDLWDKAVKFPFNLLGRGLETFYPIFYKNVPVLTISESSKRELLEKGFDNINIIQMGCDAPIEKVLKKEKKFTLLFLGRIAKAKGIEDAITAVNLVKKIYPEVQLWIIGRGNEEYVKKLEEKVSDLGLSNNIKFLGFVTEKEKISLLTKGHLLLAPSSKEGWGLTVHEAGARGTPVVSYNVSGLRDVVKDKVNGILCVANSPENLAENIIKLIKNKTLYNKLQKGAINERKKFTWENTFKETGRIIKTL